MPAAPAQRLVRLAVVGGRRGRSFHKTLERLTDAVVLAAVCDSDESVLDGWRQQYPSARSYGRFEELLDDDEVDAVLLATPLQLHARQAIAALKAGKHVLSEVTAANTLDECWELVETVEATGQTYMLAENYCFMRPNLMVENIAGQGRFGRVTHLEGAYVHDCRTLYHRDDGSLTWRGELRTSQDCVYYPTHSLGPVARWLRAANGPEDRLDTLVAFTSAHPSVRKYFAERFGDEHPGARDDFWQQGDTATALIRTSLGTLITIRVDSMSPRPHNMTHYALQGSSGAYLSARHDGEDPLVWLEGYSPGASGDDPATPPAEWESLWTHTAKFEHPLWDEHLAEATEAGHGGGDFFVLDEFVQAIRAGRKPAIDVYDAVTWSCVAPLSAQSVAAGGAPVAFPDFAINASA